MEALDLIQRAEGSDDYVFKHALVRDALYNGLLSGLVRLCTLKSPRSWSGAPAIAWPKSRRPLLITMPHTHTRGQGVRLSFNGRRQEP